MRYLKHILSLFYIISIFLIWESTNDGFISGIFIILFTIFVFSPVCIFCWVFKKPLLDYLDEYFIYSKLKESEEQRLIKKYGKKYGTAIFKNKVIIGLKKDVLINKVIRVLPGPESTKEILYFSCPPWVSNSELKPDAFGFNMIVEIKNDRVNNIRYPNGKLWIGCYSSSF